MGSTILIPLKNIKDEYPFTPCFCELGNRKIEGKKSGIIEGIEGRRKKGPVSCLLSLLCILPKATCAQQGCSPHPLLHWVWGRLQAVHRAEGKIIPHHQLLEAKEPQIWWGGQDQVWILRYWDQPIKIQRSGISFSFLPSPASRPLKGEENSALGFCLIPVSLFVTRTNCLVVIT